MTERDDMTKRKRMSEKKTLFEMLLKMNSTECGQSIEILIGSGSKCGT